MTANDIELIMTANNGTDKATTPSPAKTHETTTTTTTTTTTSPPQSFDLTTINPQATLKQTITTAVQTTNTLLSQLHSLNTTANSHIVSRIRPLGAQIKYGLQRTVQLYETRQTYGVPIVVGSAAAIGLLVGVRRGKVPAVVSGGLAGGGSYVGVYGYPK